MVLLLRIRLLFSGFYSSPEYKQELLQVLGCAGTWTPATVQQLGKGSEFIQCWVFSAHLLHVQDFTKDVYTCVVRDCFDI